MQSLWSSERETFIIFAHWSRSSIATEVQQQALRLYSLARRATWQQFEKTEPLHLKRIWVLLHYLFPPCHFPFLWYWPVFFAISGLVLFLSPILLSLTSFIFLVCLVVRHWSVFLKIAHVYCTAICHHCCWKDIVPFCVWDFNPEFFLIGLPKLIWITLRGWFFHPVKYQGEYSETSYQQRKVK